MQNMIYARINKTTSHQVLALRKPLVSTASILLRGVQLLLIIVSILEKKRPSPR